MADSWELIQQALGAGARGEELRPVNSTRTLFGIKSESELAMERIAREATEAAQAKARERKTNANSNPHVT